MSDMSVKLPDTLKDWVDAQVQAGRFVDAAEYVRDLIRRDQDANNDLIEQLESGVTSGISPRSVDEIWQTTKRNRAGG